MWIEVDTYASKQSLNWHTIYSCILFGTEAVYSCGKSKRRIWQPTNLPYSDRLTEMLRRAQPEVLFWLLKVCTSIKSLELTRAVKCSFQGIATILVARKGCASSGLSTTTLTSSTAMARRLRVSVCRTIPGYVETLFNLADRTGVILSSEHSYTHIR